MKFGTFVLVGLVLFGLLFAGANMVTGEVDTGVDVTPTVEWSATSEDVVGVSAAFGNIVRALMSVGE